MKVFLVFGRDPALLKAFDPTCGMRGIYSSRTEAMEHVKRLAEHSKKALNANNVRYLEEWADRYGESRIDREPHQIQFIKEKTIYFHTFNADQDGVLCNLWVIEREVEGSPLIALAEQAE